MGRNLLRTEVLGRWWWMKLHKTFFCHSNWEMQQELGMNNEWSPNKFNNIVRGDYPATPADVYRLQQAFLTYCIENNEPEELVKELQLNAMPQRQSEPHTASPRGRPGEHDDYIFPTVRAIILDWFTNHVKAAWYALDLEKDIYYRKFLRAVKEGEGLRKKELDILERKLIEYGREKLKPQKDIDEIIVNRAVK